MENYITSKGYIFHKGYGCRCLCHTKRSGEIIGLCPCEIEAREQLGIPNMNLDGELAQLRKFVLSICRLRTTVEHETAGRTSHWFNDLQRFDAVIIKAREICEREKS